MSALPSLLADAKRNIRWRIPGVTPSKGQPLGRRVFVRCEVVGDCWEFRAALDPDGYGRICVKGIFRRAHRIAWESVNGPIADPGLCVCHRCDNRVCCNPAHMFLGTRLDNNRDRHAKGRTVLPDPGAARGRFERAKTHCPRNHPYNEVNTYRTPKGHRRCRTCAAASRARRTTKTRQLRAA